jgi:hypothetical protein
MPPEHYNFPAHKEDREQLYNEIKKLVERGDRYIRNEINALADVQEDLRLMMQPSARYNKAATIYLYCFRDRDWVKELLDENG